MKIVIAGAGDVGTHLAKMLSKENHEIILLDQKKEKIKEEKITAHTKATMEKIKKTMKKG